MQLRTELAALLLLTLLVMPACSKAQPSKQQPLQKQGEYPSQLPAPFHTPSANKMPEVIGWPAGKTPLAPTGFTVTSYASLESPRWLHVLPNGDVLVSQASSAWRGGQSPNRITLLRGLERDGSATLQSVFIDEGLHLPFGMQLLNQYLYVADTEKLVRYPYRTGQTQMRAKPERILEMPKDGYHGHWTRNVIADPTGNQLFVAIGSASNVGEDGMEKEHRRAAILVINPDGSNERIYASGLRNPIGIAFEPGTNVLWAVVNERDGLGDDLVPDYLTSIKENGFYGWPYSYFGQNEDPRRKGERPDLVAKAIVPDYSLGAHVAALGLTFYQGNGFPEKYRGGAFIGEHGSWNRSVFSGYKVVFVPFENGRPNGPTQDFLTAFIADERRSQVYGRPVGVAIMKDGSLLVADDEGNKIWRVARVHSAN